LDERIEMVMSYMSIEDKMKTMAEQGITGKYKDGTNLAARSVSWWNEALHGVCRGCGDNGNKCPTQFPEANAMSASFNATLWHMIGDTISTEGRGKHNDSSQQPVRVATWLRNSWCCYCVVSKCVRSLLQRRRPKRTDLLCAATQYGV
jgi:hypothetical protein